MERVAQWLDAVVETCGRITAWSSLAIVLVMAGNVLLRYVFNTGSVAMQELEWHLMAPIALLSMAYAIKHDGHVRVDVAYARFPPRLQQGIEVLSFLLVAAIAVLVVHLSIPYVQQSYMNGEVSPDPGGLTHRWLLKACIPAGFALLALQSVAAALRIVIARPETADPASLSSVTPSEHAAQ